MSQTSASKPLEIKISTVVAVAALLGTADLDTLKQELRKLTGGTPDYFDNEFAVLDLAGCGDMALDWPGLIALFKSFSLNPVAVRNAPADMEADIVANGLSIDVVAPQAGAREAAAAAPAPAPAAPAPAPAPAPQAAAPVPAMIIDTPVRAGQRIYARGADLIVTAVVNGGAELIADGSIHVYAPLRGRALAGARGDAGARIFALSMEAELVSIAGTYRTFENGIPADVERNAAQIRLDGDRIEMLPLTLRA
ncbi:septum site-determining protein MinC [Noviherbaspirillum humi]|uniref:Probable septum site-determining protein MinC n=1 Tax=Noviherbaspirillum humi TaxID=1688639 RepID=A0A239DCX4_9BURK|nr:septum site-determining protein MinC [Noviherbaspirillum humi]SNS30276.1 septum site-determining protein MinC [Noviherbaspirillum humi]